MAIVKLVSKDGKASYRVKVFQGYDEAGKRREVTKTCPTKKEAVLAEADIKCQLERGTFIKPHRKTVAEYLEEWLEKSVRAKLSPQTLQLYRNVVRIYIVSAIGHLQLAKLRPTVLQGLLNELSEGRKQPAEPGRKALKERLGASTVKNVQTVLRSAFRQAVKWEYLHTSPAAYLDLPRPDVAAEELRQEVRAMDQDQAKAFLDAAGRERWGVVLAFALLTGARPGEYLALLWSDLDWTTQTVRIERTIYRPPGGGWKFGVPKTRSSYRTVSLSTEMMDILRQHRLEQLAQREALGLVWEDSHDFIFRNERGGPMEGKRLARRYFKRVLQAASLPAEFVLYNLRHTCATLLLLLGEPAKVVADRLGHSSVSTTLDVYSRVLPTLKSRAADKLQGLLLPLRSPGSLLTGQG